MNKTTCIAECDKLGYSLKQVHIIIYIRHQQWNTWLKSWFDNIWSLLHKRNIWYCKRQLSSWFDNIWSRLHKRNIWYCKRQLSSWFDNIWSRLHKRNIWYCKRQLSSWFDNIFLPFSQRKTLNIINTYYHFDLTTFYSSFSAMV